MKEEQEELERIDDVKLYDLQAVSEIVGVTRVTLLKYIRIGRLKAVKMGKWKVSGKNLKAFMNGEE